MPTPRAGKSSAAKRAAPPADVDAFVAALDHPHADAIRALRAIILGVDPRVAAEIKWNAPSFRTSEHFATFQLRAREGVQLILHFGARKRPELPSRAAIRDPGGLLEWLAPDRASVRFRDDADVKARRPAFEAVLRDWIAHV